MLELLAPAGSQEALVAAVENGADAVYLAGDKFGARAYAANFTADGLRDAIRFAHLRGVAVHVAVNTIVDDAEMKDLSDYLRFLYNAGADAVLVQDLGAARLARRIVPALPLHASTQMTVHNLAGVLALEHLGFTRVVLARELSLDDIRYICSHSRAEIEVFAHGALCVCYSGQCLMSSLIGGRSGNRGRCAQPCRLPYTLVDAAGNDMLGTRAGQFLLSPRDLNTAGILPELMAAGVASLKIEGRMKRPEYVAVVTGVYRRAIDAAFLAADIHLSEADFQALAQVFNRDFTTAYLKDDPGRAMISDRKPNNRGLLVGRVLRYDKAERMVTVKLFKEIRPGDEIDFWIKVGGRTTVTVTEIKDAAGNLLPVGKAGETVRFFMAHTVQEHDRLFRIYDAALMKEAQKTFKIGAPVRRISLRAHLKAVVGKPITLEFITTDGFRGTAASDFIGAAAEKKPLTREAAEKQIARLGATVYRLDAFAADIAPDVMVPVSVLNDLRRRASEALDEARLKKYARADLSSLPVPRALRVRRAAATETKLMVSVDSLAAARQALDAGADGLLFGGDSYRHQRLAAVDYQAAWELARQRGRLIHFNTPRILRENEVPKFKELLRAFQNFPADGINVHNIGTLALVREYTDIPVQNDFSLIAYNLEAITALKELGVTRITLSPELNLRQIEALAAYSPLPLEAIAGGYLELMVSAYCAVGSFLGEKGTHKCSAPCEKQRYFLKDRKDAKFPLVMDGSCQMHILNSQPLSMLLHVGRFAALGVDRIRIEGRYYSGGELTEQIRRYHEFMLYDDSLSGEAEERCQRMEGTNFTRGHYFRGVL